MTRYLNVNDENFYKSTNKIFSKYKIPADKKTLKTICFPTKYELQIPQLFLADFINPKTPYKGILVNYGIGSGKTCTGVRIGENFKNHKHIMIVAPASLLDNFRGELRSPCAEYNYISNRDRELLKKLDPSSQEYKVIIKKSNDKIDKYYTIYSYDIFIRLLIQGKINLVNTLLIIDEVHNMVSETGIRYETLYNAVHGKAEPTLRLVIMTATPIYNDPIELALTMNLLLPLDNQLPTGRKFVEKYMDITYTKAGPMYKVKNMDHFKEKIKGYVSYYRGAPPVAYPRSKISYVRTKMSDKQLLLYKRIISKEGKSTKVKDYVNEDVSNSFFIGSRAISNIVYPNGKLRVKGFESMEDSDYTIDSMKELSPKFVKILRKIKKCEGTVFVYSNFKGYAGLRIFSEFLQHHGYKNYSNNGSGPKRFGIFSGDETKQYKDEIKAVFNNKNNVDGSMLKIILGSASAKEGISLLRLAEIHLIDVYWNFSRMNQIIGRGLRFCSHKDVPFDKQNVDIYIYLAVHPDIKISIDEYILKMAFNKESINKQFITALKECAIDCQLFKNANYYKGEPEYNCDS